MTVTIGTDSYGDETGLQAYADKRGVTIAGDLTILLYKSMDWIEIQSYLFVKYLSTQSLQFPRDKWYYDEEAGVVPPDVVNAQYVLSLLIDSGEDPNAIIEPSIRMEQVDVIEIGYENGNDGINLYPEVSQLLKRYLSSSLTSFVVSRG